MRLLRRFWPQILAFVAIGVLTLLPFFGVGFVTDDDFQYFITARHPGQRWLMDAHYYAVCAGRFYFLLTKYFYYVPYLVDSFAYTKVVQYLTLIACYLLFSYLVFRLFRSQRLALLTLLLVVFNTAITSQDCFIPNIYYPFYFAFSLMIFMLALVCYINYVERGSYCQLVASALLCLLAFLFYETYLVFALFLMVAVFLRHWHASGRQFFASRAFWKELLPFVVVGLLYVSCYVGFRLYLRVAYPDVDIYDGSRFDVSRFSLSNFFTVLERCTRIAIPGQTYFYNRGLISDNTLLLTGHHRGFDIFAHASVAVWINAILQTALLCWLTRGRTLQSLSWRKIIVGILAAVAVAYGAHTLIAITPKYNIEWSHWMRGYVTSFYSIFALMLALSLLIAASLKPLCSQRVARVVRGCWCVAMLLLSVLIGYTNEHLSREYQKCYSRLRAIDWIAKQGYFDTLPADALLYTQALHHTPGIHYNYDGQHDMADYISLRAGRDIASTTDWQQMVASSDTCPARPLYYVHCAAAPRQGDLLVAFSRLDGPLPPSPDSLSASYADVFYLSPSKQFTLFYRDADAIRAVPHLPGDRHQPLSHVSISADSISPYSFYVSNISDPNQQP
ncbi:MAG: hypothetical protein IJ620_03740 [Bacteroidales bacterium]|nr:hypothetical protein [Bacteroidales bacterium]